MTRLSISCESCGLSWAIVSTFTVYEREALESRPCPGCGAYTLCCPGPESRRPLRTPWMKRATASTPHSRHSAHKKAEGF